MSGREGQELEGITLLGNQKTKYPDDYAPEVLETFENKHPDNDYFVKFNAPEFTSLCPITGQPDFATIYISYVPGERMVESKSLKLYLYSFRNHGDFHEDCMNIIMKDLIKLMDPNILKYGENLHREEVFLSIHTATMENQEQNGRKLHGTDYLTMICIRRRSIIARNM